MTLFLYLIPAITFALSDYTPQVKPKLRPKFKKNIYVAPRPGKKSISAYYNSLNIKTRDQGVLQMWGVKSYFYPLNDLTVNMNIWGGTSRDTVIANTPQFKEGNPSFGATVTWIKIPKIDLSAEVVVGHSQSPYAHSRTDRILKISSSKNLAPLKLALEYSYRFTGNKKNIDEIDFGNVILTTFEITSHFSRVTLGLKGGAGRILSGGELDETLSFSGIGPRLTLIYSPRLSFTLNGDLRMNKVNHQKILQTKLFQMPYLMGSSLYLNCDVSL